MNVEIKTNSLDAAQDDREWRSFRYVLGEMSPAEAEAFEEILATDQEARELVAQSTGLVTSLLELRGDNVAVPGSRHGSPVTGWVDRPVGTVRPADSPARALTQSPELSRQRSKRANWAINWAITGVAAAVCCCVAVGIYFIPLSGPSGLEDLYSGDLSENSAGHLVAIWSQRLAELAPETATTELAASERSELPLPGEADDSRLATATENAPADSAAVGDQIAADDSDIPGWMIAAVEVGQVHKPDGSSSSGI